MIPDEQIIPVHTCDDRIRKILEFKSRIEICVFTENQSNSNGEV